VQSEALKDDEMANPNFAKNTHWFICLSVCLVLTLAVVIAVRNAGRWLVREDTLAAADAIL
jgi:nicotinamide riboside transporter PnuC